MTESLSRAALRALKGELLRSRDTLVPPAFADLWQTPRFSVWYGGRGAAKSWSISRILLSLAHESPLRVLCCREIQGSIRESAYRLLADQIQMLELDDAFDVQADSIVGKNGSRFFFEGLRYNASKIRSYEGVDIVWAEEAQSVSEMSWETLLPTIRKPGSRFYISYNPMDKTDPVGRRFVENTPPNSIVRKVSFRDNPFLSPESDDERLWLEKTDPDAYRHVWEGEPRTVSDALILKDKYSVAEFEISPAWAGPYYGLDYGFSSDPCAALQCHVDDDTRTLYVSKEYWQLHADIDALPAALEAAIPGISRHVVYADSARPESTSYLTRNGIPNARSTEKWPGSVDDGIAYLRSFSRIVIDPSCRKFIDECGSYSFKTDRLTGIPLPEPIDANNHCLAEGTLISTARGEIPIEQVTVEDRVQTRAGLQRVLWSGVSGKNRSACRVTTRGGLTLDATPDHEVFTTNKGFTRVDALESGDEVLTWQESKQLNIGSWSGGDIPIRPSGRIACITGPSVRAHALARCICTGRLGLMLTGLYRRAITSTMSMVTRATTLLQTCSAYLDMNTFRSITYTSPLSVQFGGARTWTASGLLLALGMPVRKAMPGTPRMAAVCGRVGRLYGRWFASAAASHTAPMPYSRGLNSVLTSASHVHVGRLGLMTSSAGVLNAGKCSRPTSIHGGLPVADHVVGVTDLGIAERVYDLTIESQHEFFANGILVHNCIDSLRYALSPLIRNLPVGGYFSRAALLENGEPVEGGGARLMRITATAAVCDRAGSAVGVVYWGRAYGKPLVVLDYAIAEVQQACSGAWIAGVFARCQELRAELNPVEAVTELRVETGELFDAMSDAFAGYLVANNMLTSGRPPYDLVPIEALTLPVGNLDQRAAEVRMSVNSGSVKLSRHAYAQQTTHRDSATNHLTSQLFGFRPGADAAQELVGAFVLGMLMARGGALIQQEPATLPAVLVAPKSVTVADHHAAHIAKYQAELAAWKAKEAEAIAGIRVRLHDPLWQPSGWFQLGIGRPPASPGQPV